MGCIWEGIATQIEGAIDVGYSLKAACSNCGQCGTVDDIVLVCFRCGKRHEITEEQRRRRDGDLALWAVWSAPGTPREPVTAAVSYAMPGTPGDLYRFNGWTKVGGTARISVPAEFASYSRHVSPFGDGLRPESPMETSIRWVCRAFRAKLPETPELAFRGLFERTSHEPVTG
jgi:hypothetical protein